jgi:hypothetical protein
MNSRILILGVALACATSFVTTTASAQNIGKIKQGARTAAAGISVSTQNGVSTITYQGKAVWTGKTTGQILGRSKVVGNVTYAAAFDGNKVIWENVPGAGAKVK